MPKKIIKINRAIHYVKECNVYGVVRRQYITMTGLPVVCEDCHYKPKGKKK